METSSELKELVGEIFQLTGQKVGFDDPIVVAALIHSQLIRRAGHDAMTSIQSAVDKVLVDLAEAVKDERKAAADISQATASAYQQVVIAAKAATESEGPKMQAQFISIAQDVLQQVKKEAGAAAPAGWKIKVGLALSSVVLLGGLAGVVIGSTWYGKPSKSLDEVKQLAAGKDFLQILPQLDPPTREKLVRLIEKNR